MYKKIKHFLHQHDAHWDVRHDNVNFDKERALIICTFLFIIGLFMFIYNHFRNNPGLFTEYRRNIAQYFVFLWDPSKTKAAREERAINTLVSEPIPSGKFLSVFRQRRQGNQLAVEFKALARNQEDHTTNAAFRNVLLNNKQEVVPYDHSRVIVWDRPDNLGSDYINASYIDGYNGPKEYIACQGPNTKCLVSFWHMVWQEGVTCIVMATGLFENAMQQCDKYWVDHTRKHIQLGSVHIWHERSTYLAQLNIRTFRIQKEGCLESRLLTHYEMVGFHDENPDPGLLLDVRRRVNALTTTQPGPVLVHCRCGGGRTAVYIALDYCLHQLQSEDRVDVYSSVLHLRRFRKNMVRTLSQYKQIYSAVAMFLQCGLTVYPADMLPGAYQVHYAHGSDSKHQKLEREFQTLQSIVPRLSIGDCASGHRVENRCKSRDIMMLPPECARPYLTTTDCADSGTDFINAVYIDGYHSENSYLVTQWPMKKTAGDFWRLIFDFRIISVAFMNDPQKFTRSYPRFWPKEVDQIACYGPISVRYIRYERQTCIVTRTFAIRKFMNNLIGGELRQDEVAVKMFQVLNAGQSSGDNSHHGRANNSSSDTHYCHSHRSSSIKDGERARRHSRGVGLSSKSLLALMEHVTDWQRRSNSRQPICIMSKDGSSRAGLYCAVAVCCDQVRVEREVDVFNAVRLVRKNRPQLVPNIDEYRYIYHFMTEFILLSGSKPDIIISESTGVHLPYTDSQHSPTTPTALPSSILHGGVYVVTKGRGSDSLDLHNKNDSFTHVPSELWSCNEAVSSSAKQFSCISYSGRYIDSKQNGGPLTLGCVVPCKLDNDGRLKTLSGDHSRILPLSGGDDNCRNVPSTNSMKLLQQNISPSGCSGYIQTYSQILSDSTLQPLGDIHYGSTLQPLGDIHHGSSDISITRTSPPCQSPDLSPLKTYSSFSSLHIPSPSPTALSPTPFLTPKKYHNGLGTNISPRSLCKSSSFYSCKSSLSNSSNFFRNGLLLKHAENGGIHSSNTFSGILLQPTCLNGHIGGSRIHPEKSSPDKHSVYTGLSSSLPTSGLLHPDLGNMQVCGTDSGSGLITLIHASYASLDDSPSGSADGRDHCSLECLDHDREAVKLKQSQVRNDISHTPSCVQVNSDRQTQGDQKIKGQSLDDTTNFINKLPALNLIQKIKGYRFRKQIKQINVN